jgi:HD-GYP domain-containing protein (c-di-GMP phosphodiesterase class II)
LTRVRIRADLLQVGAPVPFDVYNSKGRLLLRRGHLVESELQFERLVQSGLYDPDSVDAQRRPAFDRSDRTVHEFGRLPSQLPRNRISIFERLTEVAQGLDDLLSLRISAEGFGAGVSAAVASIRQCCTLDSDAALAQILLSEPLRYSVRHPTNVAILTAILLSRLRHDEIRTQSAIAAALTMNVSIIGLQDTLFRQQEPLTSEQRTALKLHPSQSAKALRALGIGDSTWLQAVEQHHEARDGSGYPASLKDPVICREAQVVSLADRYCALVSQRGYRAALAPRNAIKDLYERNATAIDSALIGTLIASVGLFQPGAYVRLANGETAVVVHRLLDPKHPVVYALHQDTTAPYESPKKRLTSSHRDFDIVADVKPTAVRVKINPDQLWPPSATGDAPTENPSLPRSPPA